MPHGRLGEASRLSGAVLLFARALAAFGSRLAGRCSLSSRLVNLPLTVMFYFQSVIMLCVFINTHIHVYIMTYEHNFEAKL